MSHDLDIGYIRCLMTTCSNLLILSCVLIDQMISFGRDALQGRTSRLLTLMLERFPIRWNHLIEKESIRFKELEHVGIEKVGQLFRNMLMLA
jgi:hypothetical protein